jgi:predicted metal-dependent phosphoesterase TrpH
MGLADLHIHTIHSPDGIASVPAVLKHVAQDTDLDVIAITDHNSMDGVRQALDLAPRYGIEVIPGCEISTAEGHLLALFIDKPVPAGLSLAQTLRRVGAMGGLCIAPHPMALSCPSLSLDAIRAALAQPALARTLVGIEVYNGGLLKTRHNRTVSARARQLPVADVGNSDSHILHTIGQGSTHFAGHSAADLRRALETATTTALEGIGLGGLALLRSWAPRYALRALGWVPWNSDPRRPIEYARVHQIMAHRQPV